MNKTEKKKEKRKSLRSCVFERHRVMPRNFCKIKDVYVLSVSKSNLWNLMGKLRHYSVVNSLRFTAYWKLRLYCTIQWNCYYMRQLVQS